MDNENNMFYGATPSIFENAKTLRKNPTKAEKILWDKLKGKQLGVKFRRQHPIYTYVADFYCHEKKLVIEVDGGYHFKQEQQELDQLREQIIEDFGIRVIRFTNEQVLQGIDNVIKEIRRVLILHTPES